MQTTSSQPFGRASSVLHVYLESTSCGQGAQLFPPMADNKYRASTTVHTLLQAFKVSSLPSTLGHPNSPIFSVVRSLKHRQAR